MVLYIDFHYTFLIKLYPLYSITKIPSNISVILINVGNVTNTPPTIIKKGPISDTSLIRII